jgi:hypothetical protein
MVCYDPIDLESGQVTIKCGHMYCPGCFVKHMKTDNKCAMCRVELKLKGLLTEGQKNEWAELLAKSYMSSQCTQIRTQQNKGIESMILNQIIPYISTDYRENKLLVKRVLMRNDIFAVLYDSLKHISRISIDTTSKWYGIDGRENQPIRSVAMRGLSRQEVNDANEVVRNGRTGGHWGVHSNQEHTDEML